VYLKLVKLITGRKKMERITKTLLLTTDLKGVRSNRRVLVDAPCFLESRMKGSESFQPISPT